MSQQVSPTSPMSPEIILREGAIFVSDAHYAHNRNQELYNFLSDIASRKIKTPQLLFMGDIFDALFGGIPYTYIENQKMIQLLQKIASEIEVIYFEGNHDFNLRGLFEKIRMVPIAKQPLLAEFELSGEKVMLAHGDFDGKMGYKVYTKLIRNPFVLFVLKYIDIALGHKILHVVESHLQKKDDCKALEWFDDFITSRFGSRFVCDYFVEGHFHQNRRIKLDTFCYINLGAFACNQRYFIVKSTKAKKFDVAQECYKEM